MTQKSGHIENNPIAKFLKAISSKEFLDFGKEDIAYVRPVKIDGQKLFAIHAADGTPLSIMQNKREAVMVVEKNDMEAATVH